MTHAAIFRGLTPSQEAGAACIVCRAPLDVPDSPDSVVVGSASVGPVRACVSSCAPLLGPVPQDEQLTIGGEQ